MVELHRRADVERSQLRVGEIRVDAGQVRVADVDTQSGEPPAAHDRRADTEPVDLAHLDGDIGADVVGAMHDHRTRAGRRADHELIPPLQPANPQVVGEHPDTVTAHLGDGTVGVAVVHVPVVRADTVREAVEHARGQRAPAVVTRSTPSAPRPRRRSHSAATAAGARSSPACRSGSSTKSFCVPWPLANFTSSGYVSGDAAPAPTTSSASPAADPSSHTIR